MADETPTEPRDPRSFMSNAFQAGVEAFMRGGPFDTSKSDDWKEGWNFSMKMAFWRNTFNYTFGRMP